MAPSTSTLLLALLLMFAVGVHAQSNSTTNTTTANTTAAAEPVVPQSLQTQAACAMMGNAANDPSVAAACGLARLNDLANQMNDTLGAARTMEAQKFVVETFYSSDAERQISADQNSTANSTANSTDATSSNNNNNSSSSAATSSADSSNSANATANVPVAAPSDNSAANATNSTTNATAGNNTNDTNAQVPSPSPNEQQLTLNVTKALCEACTCMKNGETSLCPCELQLAQLCASEHLRRRLLSNNGSIEVTLRQVMNSQGAWVTVAAAYVTSDWPTLQPAEPLVNAETISNPFFMRSQYAEVLKLVNARQLKGNFDDTMQQLMRLLNRVDRHQEFKFQFPSSFVSLLNAGDAAAASIYGTFGEQPKQKAQKRLQFFKSGVKVLGESIEETSSIIWSFLVDIASTKSVIKSHTSHYRQQMRYFIEDVANANSIIGLYERPFRGALQTLQLCSGASSESMLLADTAITAISKFIGDADKVLFSSRAYHSQARAFPKVIKNIADLESQLRATVDNLSQHRAALAGVALNDVPEATRLLALPTAPRCASFATQATVTGQAPMDWSIPRSASSAFLGSASQSSASKAMFDLTNLRGWRAEAAAMASNTTGANSNAISSASDSLTVAMAAVSRAISNKAATRYVAKALEMYRSLNQSVCALERIVQTPGFRIRETSPDLLLTQSVDTPDNIRRLAMIATRTRGAVGRLRKSIDALVVDARTFYSTFNRDLAVHASVLQREMQNIAQNTSSMASDFEVLHYQAVKFHRHLGYESEACFDQRELLDQFKQGVGRAVKFIGRTKVMLTRWRNIHALAFVEHFATFASWLDEYEDDERTFYRTLTKLKERTDELLDYVGQYAASVYSLQMNQEPLCAVF